MNPSTSFMLLPAIDLRGGRVVRLEQGDFTRATEYGDDPVSVARQFADAGATALHIVDLDGARSGRPAQIELIRRIAAAVDGRALCEVAGGLRSAEAVSDALEAGAWRVVLGTAALRDRGLIERVVGQHGSERIVVALDVRDGRAVGDAWRPDAAGTSVDAVLVDLAAAGATTFEVTAIDRDGLLGGADLELLGRLVAPGRGDIIASGGVASLEDLRAVRAIGCAGAIVGRALYEGRVELAAAVRVAAEAPAS